MSLKIEDYQRPASNPEHVRDRRFRNIKCIAASDESESALIVGNSYLELTATSEDSIQPKGIGVHSDKGTIVRGPLSMAGGLDKIRVSGLWTLNPTLMTTVPSTAASPVSVLNIDIPFKGIMRTVGALTQLAALAAAVA